MSIDITLYFEETPCGSRSWPVVPRVRESVQFERNDTLHTGRVVQVIWDYTPEPSERAQVRVYLE